jgi:hypothetical protein
VPQQLAPLHTDNVSSSKPLSAAALASWRLNSSASVKIVRRLASNSSRDRSWALTPGTSSTQPIHQSPSRFRIAVWEYQISHGQLLIRSPKAAATATAPLRNTNVDLVCLGVEYMGVARAFNGIELLEPTSEEIRNIEGLLGRMIDPKKIKILASAGKRFPIVASSFSFSENDWDIFESPFQFRSQFRDKP